MWIVKNLGLVGLYKGASACLLRDGKNERMRCFYFREYAF
jgi:solute carrier family 25 aspartate/glutamate transporter 12/13